MRDREIEAAAAASGELPQIKSKHTNCFQTNYGISMAGDDAKRQ